MLASITFYCVCTFSHILALVQTDIGIRICRDISFRSHCWHPDRTIRSSWIWEWVWCVIKFNSWVLMSVLDLPRLLYERIVQSARHIALHIVVIRYLTTLFYRLKYHVLLWYDLVRSSPVWSTTGWAVHPEGTLWLAEPSNYPAEGRNRHKSGKASADQ